MSYLSAGVAVDLVLDPFAGQGQRKLERLNAAGCAAWNRTKLKSRIDNVIRVSVT